MEDCTGHLLSVHCGFTTTYLAWVLPYIVLGNVGLAGLIGREMHGRAWAQPLRLLSHHGGYNGDTLIDLLRNDLQVFLQSHSRHPHRTRQ